MDYKETLNLPKTNFSMKADLSKKEPEILKFWDEIHLYKKMREKNKGKPKYILHDGPPYANGHVHIGTALNKILKDIVVKYKSMRGYDAPYIPGWDCHGLPVEFQLFKELGISKNEISQLEFRKKAKNYALNFVKIQKEEFKRLGVIGDWEHPYLTMEYNYEMKIIKVFAELVKQGYIYKDLKPVYWCATCETALAEAEVEYNDKQSTSIFVRFPVIDSEKRFGIKEPVSFLIWTTTPWTLVANEAVAIHPEYDYNFVKINGESIIVAKKRWDKELHSKLGGSIEFEILQSEKGKNLAGISCKHPFYKDKVSRTILEEYVTLEEGTGCVHTAPGHGEEDYVAGKKEGLNIFSPVNNKGKYTDEAPDFLRDKSVLNNETTLIILKYLEENELLYPVLLPTFNNSEIITHSYPHCWRCKNPIIFRATEQWFLDVDKQGLRKNILDEIKNVKWVPEIGKNRITAMMEIRPDWCLSRQRYWGVPLPIFYCKECGEVLMTQESIQAVWELFGREGSDAWFIYEPEEILKLKNGDSPRCPKCKKNKFRKETDILDVWFDSGVSYEAVVRSHSDLSFPSDLYLEGSDQHRGWFQHSFISAMGALKKSPFKTVLTHGFVVDGEGRKMSKSLGNVMGPEEVISHGGADILRLWVCSQNYTEDIRISEEILGHLTDAYRKIRNTIRFLLGNLHNFKKEDGISCSELIEIDRFMLSRLQKLIEEVTLSYEKFEYYRSFRLLYNFCTVSLSAFYLDVSKDRLYTFKAKSKERLSVQTIIFEIAQVLIKMLSPFISFTAEESWSYLGVDKESVFLNDWPGAKKEWIDENLEKRWSRILTLREAVNRELEVKRKESVIGNSLEAMIEIYTSDDAAFDFLDSGRNLWGTVFIISQVNIEKLAKDDYEKIELAMVSIEGIGNLKIRVQKAKGKKCIRCWNYSENVGLNAGHPEICERCLRQIK
ncbi:isoleucine--tRNA ligase [Candidatus Desantisbacteria bacterium CG1_02_38_46]|uniref:Isoleucine--tRNA ligase n=2 Tax=unclassified Candidatus Desantisiibacteriota TaxID=3106372 RepID=A0A1J4SB72_9BACT|nr:MAG: isoleucine--tRNA ligase [Candidatus Desantisbacteria bacterium CG1_02_38_46]PIU50871.1 MAG: isoleucine--tRNA ligase [Candidatus Desantisbacteria bacterium CG07_land_8_20_14_0_80_39_15]